MTSQVFSLELPESVDLSTQRQTLRNLIAVFLYTKGLISRKDARSMAGEDPEKLRAESPELQFSVTIESSLSKGSGELGTAFRGIRGIRSKAQGAISKEEAFQKLISTKPSKIAVNSTEFIRSEREKMDPRNKRSS